MELPTLTSTPLESIAMIHRPFLAVALTLGTLIGHSLAADEADSGGSGDAAGHYAEVNGITMYYEIHGEGEPLVLLHGFFGSGTLWKSYIDEFAKHYKLIIPDLRGHGRSTNPTNEFTHRQAALDVYALLDTLKIETFQAMGISTGGNILIHMATQQTERPEAIVLIFATTYHSQGAREKIRQWSLEHAPDKLRQDLQEWHKEGDHQIQALSAQFHKFAERYDDMNFTPPYLATIKARTLIVHGDRDEFVPISAAIEMYCNIATSYLWIIPNGKHEVPEDKNRVALMGKSSEFLSGEWERDKASR